MLGGAFPLWQIFQGNGKRGSQTKIKESLITEGSTALKSRSNKFKVKKNFETK